MSVLFALVRKEASDVVRDMRLLLFGLVYAIATGGIAYGFVSSTLTEQAAGRAPPNALVIAAPLALVNMLFVLILGATFVLDAVGRERDEGMLGLLLTTRASHGQVLVAKVTVALLAYLLLAGLGLLSAAIMAGAMGPVLLRASAAVLAGPLLVLFVFLLGTGRLLSVVLPSGRLALGVGFAFFLVLFLVGATPVFGALFPQPWMKDALAWTPFATASEGQTVVITGGATPWAHYAGSLVVGVASLLVAWWIFRSKEVPQG